MNYQLRDIHPDLWAQFKARSGETGIPMRTLILLLIESFLRSEITVSANRTRG